MCEKKESTVKSVISVIEPIPGEKWWGGTTFFGNDQPYSTIEPRDIEARSYCNPCAPLFVSSKGRYIWSDLPFEFSFDDGVLTIRSTVPVSPVQAGKTLREAYLAVVRDHIKLSGKLPDESFFVKPQFNTYVECVARGGMDEKRVEEYVDGLVASGIPCGVLMLDDGWTDSVNYGDLAFSESRFPNARKLMAKIRAAGFHTILWTTPYFARTSKEYADLDARGWFLKNSITGETHPATYYPGLPAFGMLDVFDESKWDAIEKRYMDFCRDMGVDGFKFDFTDADCAYRVPDPSIEGDPLPEGKLACDYTEAWGRFASRFAFNELRAGYNYGGLPLVVRLQDKAHSWDDLRLLIPDMLAAGLLGCAYTCPDMIGGGAAGTFRDAEVDGSLDHKLFVRSCQTQALMPMMQFSAAPWRVLTEEELDICREMGKLHERFSPYILKMARRAAETGEPIVRTMEYAFPGQGFDRCMQQYMLGDDYLVAPVVHEDDSAAVELPAGTWKDDLGEIHEGPKVLDLRNVPLCRLPYFQAIPADKQ